MVGKYCRLGAGEGVCRAFYEFGAKYLGCAIQ